MKGIIMITIISKLENNLFDEILIKKGVNKVNDLIVAKLLLENATFTTMCVNGYIKIMENEQPNPNIDDKTPDINTMKYQELLKYVKAHQIKTEGTKKADLLAAIENYMKGDK